MRHSRRNGRIGLRRSSFHTGDGSSPVYFPYLHRSIRVGREVRTCSRLHVPASSGDGGLPSSRFSSLVPSSPFLWMPSFARSGFSSLVFLVLCSRVSYRVPCSRPYTRGPAVKLLKYPAVQYVRDGGQDTEIGRQRRVGSPATLSHPRFQRIDCASLDDVEFPPVSAVCNTS